MPTEGFFSRWSRLKTEPAPAAPGAGEGTARGLDASAAAPAGQAAAARQALTPAWQGAHSTHGGPDQEGGEDASMRRPTLDDVARLGADSDYSAFVARGVDKSVQRGAMKKLFADPHFNIGDGLDLYMGDYNRPDPIPAAMMSALRHTESFFAQAYPERQSGKDSEAEEADAAGQAGPVDSDGAASTEPADTAVATGADDTGIEGDAGGAAPAPAIAATLPPQTVQPIPERLMANTTGAPGATEGTA